MSTILVWLLIAQADRGGASLLGRFASLEDCRPVALEIKRQSSSVRGMSYVNAICVEARIMEKP